MSARIVVVITYNILFVSPSSYYSVGVICMSGKLLIKKKGTLRGEDGYKIFSIRVKDTTVAALDKLANASNRSRNELINIMLEHSIQNTQIED